MSKIRVLESPDERSSDGKKFIFRAWITRNGKRIYAKDVGKKAFKICVRH